MANYECTIRSNFFHVKDVEEFREFMRHVHSLEGFINLFEKVDESGRITFSFGTYGPIFGYVNGADEENEDFDADIAYDAFVNGLQRYVAEDDAVIIAEAGNEKLRSVVGTVLVITNSDTKYLEIWEIAVETARKILKNVNYNTEYEE